MRWLVALITVACFAAPADGPAADQPPQAPADAGLRRDFMRGMVVSCPRAGQIWGSPAMTEALRAMRPLGIQWVAVHPYAGVRRDGTLRSTPATETGYLAEAAQRIQSEHMSLFWKPHLAYWGSFSWRGAIDFGDDPSAWNRFFEGYRRFIVDQARFAEAVGAPLFAVGVELDRTLGRESEWRSLIAAVRQVYNGRLVYAANWDAVDRVPFWDALDLIGVHAYFPLAAAGPVEREAIGVAWRRHLARLDELSRRHRRPIVLAEIGYTRSDRAATEPWAYGTTDTPANRELRRLLIETAIEEIERVPAIEGMFWWKWIPGNDRWDRDFSMKDPEAMAALNGLWGPRADAALEPAR